MDYFLGCYIEKLLWNFLENPHFKHSSKRTISDCNLTKHYHSSKDVFLRIFQTFWEHPFLRTPLDDRFWTSTTYPKLLTKLLLKPPEVFRRYVAQLQENTRREVWFQQSCFAACFRTPFLKNTSRGALLQIDFIFSWLLLYN